jgi:GntR family transcriptional regulator, transcriptional repressor for pyruvate dehydrogenase complex
MKTSLKPINADSLKQAFIKKFEGLIFSGHFSIGEKLPPERELAKQLCVSRPVVHEGLVNLAAKGLVTMKPRVGTFINDYRKKGSLFLLTSLFKYDDGQVSAQLLGSMLEMRMLLEVESAGLAAVNRRDTHLTQFEILLEEERRVEATDARKLAAVDFNYHHLVAIASGNMIYPLIMNSLKQFYTNVSRQFFESPAVVPVVFEFHEKLVAAFKIKNASGARKIMRELLAHGEEHVIV